jgi:RNA polymerase sigma factor FliA
MGAAAASASAESRLRALTTTCRSNEDNEALVMRHLHLVSAIAYQMARRMPSRVEVDDLVQDGTVGLLQAAQRYEGRRGSSFSSYASRRIRGAIIDGSRRSDWCSRSLRRRIKAIEAARRRLECETGEAGRASAIAAEVGITLDEYHSTMRDFSAAAQISLDAPEFRADTVQRADPAYGGDSAEEELEREEILRVLLAKIDALPHLERTIFSLYHEQDYLMREIGAILALSESRVSQLHTRTIARLRSAARWGAR